MLDMIPQIERYVGRANAGQGQPSELYSKDQNEHQSGKELRDATQGKGNDGQHIICDRVLLERGYDARQGGPEIGKYECQNSQLQRVRQAFRKQIGHISSLDDAIAQIATEYLFHPEKVAHDDRFIQPKLDPQGLNVVLVHLHLGSHGNGHQVVQRVSRRQVLHDKIDQRDENQHGNSNNEAPGDILGHVLCSCPIVLLSSRTMGPVRYV